MNIYDLGIKTSLLVTELGESAVVDSLNSTDNQKLLSANQGKVLNDLINVLKGDGEGSIKLMIKDSLESIEEDITWSDRFNINKYTEPGVYVITGNRLSNNDNLPILNIGENASFSAKLFVTSSPEGSSMYRSIIGQTLFLSNAEGHETKIYTRSANKTSKDGGATYEVTWGDWQVCQGMKEVGLVDSYDSFIDNGMYSGIYNNNGIIETFVIITINDYVVKSQLNQSKSVSQLKYSVDAITSKIKIETRTGINEPLEWGEWSNIFDGGNLISCTYTELKTLKDNKELIPGSKYRITDYVTTTSKADTKSANHQFDIIVEALTEDTLSEDAKVCLHDGDTYFSNNDLNAWEIKYCFENDTNRFTWASITDGKGVIYYLKDEFNNECWYDFKNIQFLRTSDFFNTNSFLPHLEGDNYYFTFSNIVNNEIIDGTIYNENITVSIQNKIDKINGTKYSLNNTIFINNSSGYTRYNVIGFGNHSNTFGPKCQANTILQHCYDNVVSNEFRNNVIAQYFCNNKVSGQFEYNTLGIQCWKNDFSGHILFTTFGSQFNYCSFSIPEGSALEYCEFGSGIGFLNGIPAIRKVKFENNVAWYDSTTWVTNLQTIDGRTLAEALTVDHDDQLYVYKAGDKYGVTSFSEMQNSELVNIPTLVSNPGTLNDNANNYGYVGTLKNIGVTGDIIVVDTITSYVRTDTASPHSTTPVWCRLLKYVNNAWTIVYQSINSKKIGDYESGSEFSFKMERKLNDNLTPNDKIAIVYSSTDDITNILNSTQLGLRTVSGKTGGLNNALESGSTGAPNYQTALSLKYLSMADVPKNVVTIENAQTITGTKQFNNGLSISGKSFITSDIDSGELKVFPQGDNTTKGFIIRSANRGDTIPIVELLATNTQTSYTYSFPKKDGTVAMLNDIVNSLTSTETNKALSANQGKLLNDNKQDKLQTYTEQSRDYALITMPSTDEENNNASVKVTKTTASMFSTDNLASISTGPSGTQLIYSKRDESGSIVHDDRISIGKHNEDNPHTGTHITLTSKSTTEEAGEKLTSTSTIQVNPERISMSSPNGEIGDVVKEISGKASSESVSELRQEVEEVSKEVDEKAPKVGYAPDLKVNFAKELVGRGEATAEVIGSIRPTGVRSIGDGNATITKVRGNSVIWNQCMNIRTVDAQFNRPLYTITREGITYSITKQEGGTSSADNVFLYFSHEFKKGQKYLLRYNLRRNDGQNSDIYFHSSGIYDGTSYHNLIRVHGKDYVFFSPTESFTSTQLQISQPVTAGVALSYTIAPVIYDLTQMFGSGNEPTTIEEFESRKPLGVSNEYNEGTIVSFQGGDVKSVGFNAYNGTYAKVIGGEEYHATGTTSISFAKELDGDSTAITLDGNGKFTPTEDGYVFAEGKDIVIHLTHSYTPEHVDEYEEDVHPLPNISAIKDTNGNQLFPHGLLSAGSVHDEITATKAVKRVGVVDMGDVCYIQNDSIAGLRIHIPEAKHGINLISTKYTASVSNGIDKTIYFNDAYYGDHKGVVYDSTYSTVQDRLSAVSGVLLYYELAEPIEVDLPEPLNMTYEAWDFGTEELIHKGATTPLNADIVYQFNAVDRIRENSTNILNKQDTLVSGTNIKTINGQTILGSGDITIQGGDLTEVNQRLDDLESQALVTEDSLSPEVVTDYSLMLGDIVQTSGTSENKIMSQKAVTGYIEALRKLAISPSGDPMHNLYISAGAEYNATGANITKTVPWGESVTHKAGYWYLNGIGDLTNEDMCNIYNLKDALTMIVIAGDRGARLLQPCPVKTLYGIPEGRLLDNKRLNGGGAPFISGDIIEVLRWTNNSNKENTYTTVFTLASTAIVYGCANLHTIERTKIAVDSIIQRCPALRHWHIHGLNISMNMLSGCPNFSAESIHYIIQNAIGGTASAPITIALHSTAKANWEASAYYTEDLTKANELNITIA